MAILEKNISEETLVLMLQNGSKEAFSYLYDNYSSALYGAALKMLKTEEEAEDVLQEAFLKIWRFIGKYNSEKGRLYTWMLNILRNTAIDKLRKENKMQKVSIQKVPELVQKLPVEQQQIINYLYFGGYTQQEVSDELDIPLGTVKTRARTAIQALRKVFV